MQIRDKWLATMIALTGAWMWVAAPAKAECETAGCTRPSAASAASSKPIELSKFNKRKTHAAAKLKSKSAHSKQGAKIADAAARGKNGKSEAGRNENSDLPVLPPSIANARAELMSGDPRSLAADQARNIAAADDAEIITMDGVQIASADQLNDMDRAVADEKPDVAVAEAPSASPAPTAPTGRVVKAMPSGERQVFSNTGDADAWGKTSLIGKIFIAFGSLLTLASAARLMIA